MDLKERILEKTFSLISKYGITAVTMDSIAKECGISKRTLYEQFEDKTNLVLASIVNSNRKVDKELDAIMKEANNQLEGLLNIYTLILNNISTICDSFFRDIERLYPYIAEKYKEIRRCRIAYFRRIMERGQQEGLFKSDLNIEIVSILYFSQILNIKEVYFQYGTKYSISEIFACSFDCFIRGVATPDGLKIYENYKSKEKK